tara:strand:- start:4387 stop:5409 length:1023 start_codon:yes stop_codon:yes gene_type:complete
MKRKNSNVLKLKDFFIKDKRIKEIYSKFKLVLSRNRKNKSFVVGVSGGPDSMALVALSNSVMHEKNYKILFVLVDHGIRKNSHIEALQVKKLLKKNNIDLKILTNKKKIYKNIQKSARDVRYDLLTRYCKRNKAKSLLVAHHQDDQVETFLIRLSRGSGVEGLSSMSEVTKLKYNINLLRPFLDFKKSQLSYISKKVFGKTFKDSSNKNKKFLRTNIRNLKKTLQKKGIDFEKIIRSIKNITSSKEAINFYVNKSMKKFVQFKKNETILDLRQFKKEPGEVKFRIINNIVKKRSNSYYPPRSEKVLNLIHNFQGKNLKKCTLGGCIFERKKEFLHVSKEF